MPHPSVADSPKHILLIEDEAKIANFVMSGLTDCGFIINHCDRGDTGYQQALQQAYDLILLDVRLPGLDGFGVLNQLRQAGQSVPIILLTACDELDNRLQGFNLGAEDYITKPFFVEELMARIRVVLRRHDQTAQETVTIGALQLNCISREVRCNGHCIELTSGEFNLLLYLIRASGRVCSRMQLLQHVWGYDFSPNTNVVDVCVQRIRKKMLPLGVDHWIESIRGVGYRFRMTGEA